MGGMKRVAIPPNTLPKKIPTTKAFLQIDTLLIINQHKSNFIKK